jgi:hypothetical protein
MVLLEQPDHQVDVVLAESTPCLLAMALSASAAQGLPMNDAPQPHSHREPEHRLETGAHPLGAPPSVPSSE